MIQDLKSKEMHSVSNHALIPVIGHSKSPTKGSSCY